MEYVSETKECICGWCGQLLIPNHNNETPEAHFKTCKNSEDTGLLRVFKELRKVQQSLRVLNKKMDTVKSEVLEEVKADHLSLKTEFNNKILAIEVELEKKNGENKDEDRSILCSKVEVLENGMAEKMREMSLNQDTKMAKVNGRFSGVTETISTVVHSMLEEVKSKETTTSTETKEMDQLKRETKSLPEQNKSYVPHFQVLKRQLENVGAMDEATKKKKRFHVEPSNQMNSFNLVTRHYLFQHRFKWTIGGIKNKMERNTFKLTSRKFQWRGYPVQARAKFQLKEDDYVYMSLHLNNVQNNESSQLKDFRLIPTVFYVLKDKYSGNQSHKCQSIGYLFGSAFNFSLEFESCFVHKSWLNHSAYNVNDAVEVEIYVEPSSKAEKVHSYDGTLEWNIENYARRLQLEKDRLAFYQESPYFYTGPSGYRVRVEMFLNGNEGKGVTARVLFVTGKFDRDLPESFAHSTTVTFINRKEPERCVTKSVVEDIQNKKYYDLEVCELKDVNNLIEDDTLFCKVNIKAQ